MERPTKEQLIGSWTLQKFMHPQGEVKKNDQEFIFKADGFSNYISYTDSKTIMDIPRRWNISDEVDENGNPYLLINDEKRYIINSVTKDELIMTSTQNKMKYHYRK